MALLQPLALLLSGFFAWLNPVPAIPPEHEGLCRTVADANGAEYVVCDVDLDRYGLHLLAEDGAGRPFETFQAANGFLGERGKPAVLAMNAGMYHEDRRPVGLAVQDGREVAPVNTADGRNANFTMKPNGVFFVEGGRAFVRETNRYVEERHRPDLATQSGPMLLADGKLHPRFIEGSDSRYVRNGVCTGGDGRLVHLVLSRRPVNFWDFAVFFRDRLGCRDALFFDGQVSSLFYPALGIDYRRDRLGPILAVTER
ncbi:phosphodiester glycosidase family protein [Aureimonas leprariae]|uniref:Phosphodiester glycosidase domain-containing protein n=1 Tax=Plantimonas leprariae TaxID=2615207 RepID=A0A7V7U1V0_9HYPH|nr:phosphodiester glycosidase family protein [Aureimonas leprariae]KAB0682673.1 hypothetical protein F6X38_00850 [Aureimonas leprariae]